MEPGFTYYAFISYSQRDERFARQVQHYLEHYKLPSVLCREFPKTPRNFHPVFRDKTDLPLNTLDTALTSALAASRHLIVICSPNAAGLNAEGKNWVNWEVETFVSLRPENEQHIIPLILRREKGDRVNACLPSSISKRPLLPLDTGELGYERSLNETIARMTGLEPQKLWERHQQRLRRRKLLRCLCGAAAGIMAAVAGWWYWDYYMPHYSYYADYIERHNIPHGLHPLTKQEAAGRAAHYRFTHRLHVLEAVEYLNKDGELMGHTAPWHRSRPARMVFTYYTGEKTPMSCLHFNAKGNACALFSFSPGVIDIEPLEQAAESPSSPPPDANRKWRLAVTRNAEGVITRALFNSYGRSEATTNEQGMYGLDYVLDDLGRPVAIRFLTAHTTPEGEATDIRPGETTRGVSGYQLHYDSSGQVTHMEYVDKDGHSLPVHEPTAP